MNTSSIKNKQSFKNRFRSLSLILLAALLVILAYFQLFYQPRQVDNGIIKLERLFKPHHSDAWATRFVPGTTLIASCSVDSTVKIYEPLTGTVQMIFQHPEGVTNFDFSKDGKYLATTSYDQKIRIWKMSDGALYRELTGHTRTPWSVSFSPDGNHLLSSGEDATIKAWNVAAGTMLKDIKEHRLSVWDVKFSPDGKSFSSGSYDNRLLIWSFPDCKLTKEFTGHGQAICALDYNNSGSLLASASDDKTIRIWNTATGKTLQVLKVPEHAQGVSFSPDSKRIVTSGRDKTMIGEFLQNIFGNSELNRGVTIRVWDVASGKLLQTGVQQTNDVNDVHYSDDGKYIVSASADNTVCLWKVLK